MYIEEAGIRWGHGLESILLDVPDSPVTKARQLRLRLIEAINLIGCLESPNSVLSTHEREVFVERPSDASAARLNQQAPESASHEMPLSAEGDQPVAVHQSSHCSFGIRENSAQSWVTRIRSCAIAVAAIRASSRAITRPVDCKDARMRDACSASKAPKGITRMTCRIRSRSARRRSGLVDVLAPTIYS